MDAVSLIPKRVIYFKWMSVQVTLFFKTDILFLLSSIHHFVFLLPLSSMSSFTPCVPDPSHLTRCAFNWAPRLALAQTARPPLGQRAEFCIFSPSACAPIIKPAIYQPRAFRVRSGHRRRRTSCRCPPASSCPARCCCCYRDAASPSGDGRCWRTAPRSFCRRTRRTLGARSGNRTWWRRRPTATVWIIGQRAAGEAATRSPTVRYLIRIKHSNKTLLGCKCSTIGIVQFVWFPIINI